MALFALMMLGIALILFGAWGIGGIVSSIIFTIKIISGKSKKKGTDSLFAVISGIIGIICLAIVVFYLPH